MAIEIQPKHKFDGTAAPTITDDRDDGYSEGSRWINVLTGIEYLCVDATVGEARIQARDAAAKAAHLRWMAASMEMAA